MAQNIRTFKILLIGNGGVGKTCYIQRFKTGNFQKKYIPTTGAEVYTLRLETTAGPVELNVWDTAGQEKLGSLREGYYIGADAAILMFDLKSHLSYSKIPNWARDLFRVTSTTLPFVLVGNKSDAKERAVKPGSISFHRKYFMDYYDISAKTNFQYEKPFISILKKLLNVRQLDFTSRLDLKAPEIELTEEQKMQMEDDAKKASSAAIQEDNEF